MSIPTQTSEQGYAPPSADDFLLGGGANRKGRSMKFPMIGATNSGVICDIPRTEQQRDPETGDLKFWPPRQGQTTGDPVWQLVVPVQIDVAANPALRSAEVVEAAGVDDGVRYFYLSGSKDPASMSALSAVAEAVRASGAKKLEIGGRLTVTYVQDMPKRQGASAVSKNPKGYRAEYAPPAQVMLEAPSSNGNGNTGGNVAPAGLGQFAGTQQFSTGVADQQPPAQTAAPVQASNGYPGSPGVQSYLPEQQAQPAAQNGGGETREQAIAREFGHLPAQQLNGLIASGMAVEQIRAVMGLAPQG